jgi:hypothetical protein
LPDPGAFLSLNPTSRIHLIREKSVPNRILGKLGDSLDVEMREEARHPWTLERS